jgi:hypothetical protein
VFDAADSQNSTEAFVVDPCKNEIRFRQGGATKKGVAAVPNVAMPARMPDSRAFRKQAARVGVILRIGLTNGGVRVWDDTCQRVTLSHATAETIASLL